MKAVSISRADPRLTAYALGELEAAEVPQIEAALREDPALRAEVEAIRACAAVMQGALAGEADGPVAPARPAPAAPRRSRVRWRAFPQLYYLTGGLAAAGFVVLVAVNRDAIDEKERRRVETLRTALEQRDAGQRGEPGTRIVAVDLSPEPNAGPAVAPRRVGDTILLTADFGQAAWVALRGHLAARQLPPPGAVRPAELINAFSYRRPAPPPKGTDAVAAGIELGEAPWAPAHRLVRIGFKGREAVLAEARQGILESIARTRATIAREVRIEVEFNPAQVAGYRLIGRERDTAARDTPVDALATARELSEGQAFTALYEIVPATLAALEAKTGDLLTVRLHYAEPEGAARRTLAFSLAAGSVETAPSADFQLAAAAAEFAQILNAPDAGGAGAWREALTRVAQVGVAPADDPDGRRAEFFELVRKAQLLLE